MPPLKLPKLASLRKNGWTLGSGEDRHRANPESFQIPSLVERKNIRLGQSVKLLFEIEPSKGAEMSFERMWVTLTDRPGDGYVGILDSIPITTSPKHELKHGLEVFFRPEHVISIDDPPEDWLQKAHGKRLKFPLPN